LHIKSFSIINPMKSILKKSVPHIIAIALFLVLTCIYFSPSIFDGKTIQQGDTIQATGMSQEIHDYWEKEKGTSAWTGSMFSGMPSYHIYVHGNPPNFLNYLERFVRQIDYLGGGMILIALICFYILMCVIGVKRWLAIAGSIAFAFASFNLISIAAGHVTKVYVMAFMPLTIAGLFLLFQRKWLWGSIVLTIGICFSIMNNHLQITYYLALLCVILALGFLFIELRKKEYSDLLKAFCIAIACIVVAVLPDLGNLYANYESSLESTRGPSELTSGTDETATKASDGLDIDYAFMWSYEKGELLTLLVPNVYGGASGTPLGKDFRLHQAYRSLGAQVGKEISAPTYWGDQPFTSGPVYFGAIICFLFVLGMFNLKNPMKWWLAGAALFFCLLALGRHLSWLNDFLFYHLPMYNKFRTPAMALVIPGMILPIVGFWGLKDIFAEKTDKKQLKNALIWSTSIVGGICLVLWIMPGLFLSFQSPLDIRYEQQWPSQFVAQLMDALLADRKSLASSDAFRSLTFVLLTSALLFYFVYAKNKAKTANVIGIILMVLVLIDLWPIDKRYLNDDNFQKKELHENFRKTAADEFILQDPSPSYRVLNITVESFQDASTSYFHKSIGGYHAAKLGRYQELIDRYLTNEINQVRSAFQSATSIEDILSVFAQTPVLNMLNTKYLIFSPDQPPIVNPYAYGNAWFVENLKMVENANLEIAALGTTDLLSTAIVDKRFESILGKVGSDTIQSASIEMISYKPNILIYETNTEKDESAVFSEVYYPHDWKVFIDGSPAEIFRTDWILRGVNIPAGKHTIEFRFEPETYNALNKFGSWVSLLIVLALVGAIAYSFRKSMAKR